MSSAMRDARLLGKITSITTFGDFLTYFAVVKLIYEIHGNAFSAAFGGIGVGSAAAVFSGLSVPYLKRYLNTKTLIVLTQVVSAISIAFLYFFVSENMFSSTIPFIIILFLQTFCSKAYEASRDTHTHSLNENSSDHKNVQAILLSGMYGAQFLGPIGAFVLLKNFSYELPVALDLFTFIISIFLSFRLSRGARLSATIHVFGSISHIKRSPALAKLFLLRTVGFWVPASFFNVMIYEAAVERFQVGVEFAGVIYAVIGLGSLLGALEIRKDRSFLFGALGAQPLNRIAAVAQVGFAVSILCMFFLPTLCGESHVT
jgi:hypothetical protein